MFFLICFESCCFFLLLCFNCFIGHCVLTLALDQVWFPARSLLPCSPFVQLNIGTITRLFTSQAGWYVFRWSLRNRTGRSMLVPVCSLFMVLAGQPMCLWVHSLVVFWFHCCVCGTLSGQYAINFMVHCLQLAGVCTFGQQPGPVLLLHIVTDPERYLGTNLMTNNDKNDIVHESSGLYFNTWMIFAFIDIYIYVYVCMYVIFDDCQKREKDYVL